MKNNYREIPWWGPLLPDNDLIWEYETDWTRSLSDMRTFSPDVHM